MRQACLVANGVAKGLQLAGLLSRDEMMGLIRQATTVRRKRQVLLDELTDSGE
ncbi:hypothetical protein [Pseudomonas frederiksbergensis]|uniref:hypothetical protein n=1 Tax=Pseudomonas frederiksbergensis TaxID=104087 RepID=UPI0013748086|nr:hypothetical protein [Pseudomonas frederiksbergensis]